MKSKCRKYLILSPFRIFSKKWRLYFLLTGTVLVGQNEMKKTPTDLELLGAIYDRYYDQFLEYSEENSDRESKIYVPIDCASIAERLGVDGDIVFGRLYYDLDNRYGYTKGDGTKVSFFAFVVGKDRHCVNLPLLASVLAGLRHENKRFMVTTWIAIIALIISSVSLGVTICKEPANNQIQPTVQKSG